MDNEPFDKSFIIEGDYKEWPSPSDKKLTKEQMADTDWEKAKSDAALTSDYFEGWDSVGGEFS